MLLTPNGRFETQTKICLSISNYHPEHWQPSWSVRTALVALIAFMPTNPGGALGSLDYNKEERRKLAIKSREAAPSYGSPERQKIIDQIHQYMLTKAPPVPQLPPSSPTEEATTDPLPLEPQTLSDTNVVPAAEEAQNLELPQVAEDVHEVRVDAAAGRLRVSFRAGVSVSRSTEEAVSQAQAVAAAVQKPASDRLFTWAAVGLTVAIVVLLVKKFMKSNGIAGFMDGL
ncbi:ubiquitin-conjugating enzyme E2 32 [Iris pallida]|uniref:Ubiquitin-conjugating enzyme E2 32 n=1 Tax=Iris pallida TaxID=29817 RepID=A0AAX6I299_IRIPA|nr:ubiquitin-conjugating enzyme E2 32 [Iris pallida]